MNVVLSKFTHIYISIKFYLNGGYMENSKYRAFLASTEHGSFTKAAQVLGYTPSGISQLVTSLENDLGFALLVRDRKGVQLTENGQTILAVIREIIKQENRLTEISAEINGIETGSVTIAAYSSISSHWLPPVIKEFKERYPKIKLHLMEGIRQEVDLWLSKQQADIGFLSYKEPMPYKWFPLAQDPMVAVLPPNHSLAKSFKYPIQLCQNESFIMPALGKDDDVVELLNKFHLSPNMVFSTLENFATLNMIEQGLGMSIMNELITKRWECNVVKLPLDPPQNIILGMAIPSLEKVSPSVRKFVDLAVKHLTNLD